MDLIPFYKILKIPKTATDDEVKSAFRKLALIHHPDKGGNAETFKSISEAYTKILNGRKVLSSSYINQYWDNEFVYKNVNTSWYAKIWENNKSTKIIEPNFIVDLTFVESLFGTTKNYKPTIYGKEINISITFPPNSTTGSKHISNIVSKNTNVKIVVLVRVINETAFIKNGDDLIGSLHINPLVALVGSKTSIIGIKNNIITFNIPPNIPNNQIFRLHGEGALKADNTRGDLYVTIKFKPLTLTKEQQKIIKSWL